MHLALAILLTWAYSFKLALTVAMPLFMALTMAFPLVFPVAFYMSLKNYGCPDHFIG